MSRFNIEPLESYRLNRCQLPTSCQLCGHDNLIDAERCRTCGAPIELSRCSEPKKGQSVSAPKVLTTLGPERSGKTVFLGMLLDLLSRQRERADFTACDSASVAIQQDTVAALAQGEFPFPTEEDPERWRWAHCRLNRRARKDPHEIFMADISGKALIHELERPGTIQLFKGLFLKSFGFFVCVDAGEVSRGEKNDEFFAMRIINQMNDVREREAEKARQRMTKKQRSKPGTEHVPPIAIVLTKSDECETVFEDQTSFTRTNMPNLWELCQGLPNPVEFFAVSAVGRCAARRSSTGRHALVPLRVEPRGIIEPFRWMLGQAAE